MIHHREGLVLSPETPSTGQNTEGAVDSTYIRDTPVKSGYCQERTCLFKRCVQCATEAEALRPPT